MDPFALTQAGGSTADQFAQQGSVDWLQLAKMTVSIPVSIITRLAAADITPMTIIVARNIASVFRIFPLGYSRITESLGRLQSYSALGDAIWFGFGIKHIPLSEIFPPKACASILMELADFYGIPGELRASPKQWLNLVVVCSGIMRSTRFGLIADQFMAFYRLPHCNNRPMEDGLRDVARALQSIALITSGVLDSVTLAGGSSCGWIAAYGYCFLGLDVEIRREGRELLYRSAADGKRIGSFVEYHQPSPTERSGQVEVRSRSYFIKSMDDISSQRFEADDAMTGGFAPWGTCLTAAFGAEAVGYLLEQRVAFALAETVILLTWNLSAMQIHPDLLPCRSGLRLIYNQRERQRLHLSGRNLEKMTDGLRPESICRTAQFLFTTCTVDPTEPTNFSAASVRGICFYFDVLREISDRPDITHERYTIFPFRHPCSPSEGLRRVDGEDLDAQIVALASDTSSRDLQATLVVEETIDGLFADIRFTGSKGPCQVGAYRIMQLVMDVSHYIRCSGGSCDALTGDYDDIVLVDEEGPLP
ncbi:hypothetical protein B0T22DRAFT_486878 [Podospora appendiculata]|uniref:Uncharacterized protein n=1 Tax=Podospora appendiculata TaxID=314037 RepID=A0AAE1CG50_9PEZI|nr:hypothetical protein B0T22DRAFT_486878 [Podospora appendiculata]